MKIKALIWMAMGMLAIASDNDWALPKYDSSNRNQVQGRTTDTLGVHVPHFILDSGTVTGTFSLDSTAKIKLWDGTDTVLVTTAGSLQADLFSVNGGTAIALGAGTASGSIRVELPTDGTGKVSAAQSGTWTVQPGNTANTTAWKVDGSAVTQPISAASLPLPTSAATAANQTATQTPITPATATATSGMLLGGQYNSTPPTFTNQQQGAVQVGSRGALHVELWEPSSGQGISTGTPVDGASNAVTTLGTKNFNLLYNGSTWDRARGDLTNGAWVGLSSPVLVSSAAYEASHVLKASAGRLVSLSGYNSKATAQFIQLYNSTTVPADTAVPVWVQTVAGLSNFVFDIPMGAMPFTTGISVANSSTGPTKTIGSADVYFTAVVTP